MKNKSLLIIGGILLAGAAGYGIYYAIKSGKKDDAEGNGAAEFDQLILDAANAGGGNVNLPAPQTTAQQAYDKLPLGSFPLKKGSENKFAWILQSYLNCRFKSGLNVDGDFGTKTETALLKAYGVKSISSQEHLKQLAYLAGHTSGTCEAIALQKFANAIAAAQAKSTRKFLNFLANG